MKGERSFALCMAIFSYFKNLSIWAYLLKFTDSHVLNDEIVAPLELVFTVLEEIDFDLKFALLVYFLESNIFLFFSNFLSILFNLKIFYNFGFLKSEVDWLSYDVFVVL